MFPIWLGWDGAGGPGSVDADEGVERYVGCRNGGLTRESELLLVEMSVREEEEVAVHRAVATVQTFQIQRRCRVRWQGRRCERERFVAAGK